MIQFSIELNKNINKKEFIISLSNNDKFIGFY